MIETKGKNGPLSLEEIAALFDGQDASASVLARAENHMDRKGTYPAVSDIDEKKVSDFEHQEVSTTTSVEA